MPYSDFIPFTHQLTDASGDILRTYYRNFGASDAKGDKSLVTKADREAEKELRRLIEATFPEHGIIGEEFGKVREESEYVWVLDPIDGTSSFVIGRPIFGTLVALLHNGEPVVGAIDQPITHERWIAAKDEPTVLNKIATATSKCSTLSDAILCTTSPEYFTISQKQCFDSVSNKAKQTIYGGDCYNYALLASGQLDLVIEAGLKLHDFAALKVVVEQAGGVITDWQGKTLSAKSDGTVIAAATKALHQEALKLL